jgi:hypothetical protein
MTDTHSCPAVTAIRETTAALLIQFDDRTEKWIPKSVIHDDSEVFKDGDTGELVVKNWFAEKEGLP